MPFSTHDGVSLRWDRAGSGPAVLLVHGWTCNHTFWDRQLPALRERFTVVTVDLRGHGESSRPQKGYTVPALASDLEALVRSLRVPQIAIVGWSLGGMIALELARRLGDRVSALGLVCTTAGGLADPDNALNQRAARDSMRAGIAADFRTWARGFIAACFRDGAEAPLYPWALAQAQKTAPHVVAACLEGIIAFDLRARLASLRVPTAILHGRHDRLLPLGNGEHLAAHVPGATLTVFEHSGHAPFLEEPEAFDAALLALLARTSRPGGRADPSAPSGPDRPTTNR